MNPMQVLLNTLVWGSEIGLIAIGMSLSYSILGFANFAHIDFLTLGAYIAWVANYVLGIPISVSAMLAMSGTGLLAIGMDRLVFRRLRRSTAALKMIASVGVGLGLRSAFPLLFSTESQHFGLHARSPVIVFGARLTTLHMWIIGITAVSILLFHVLMSRTKVGRALRATSQNLALAQTRGIDGERMISLMWFISGAFAALGGTLLGLDTQIRAAMGTTVMVPVFAAVVLGGLGSVYGAIAGALVVSSAQNLGLTVDFGRLVGLGRSWLLPTVHKNTVALAVLILALILRRPERSD